MLFFHACKYYASFFPYSPAEIFHHKFSAPYSTERSPKKSSLKTRGPYYTLFIKQEKIDIASNRRSKAAITTYRRFMWDRTSAGSEPISSYPGCEPIGSCVIRGFRRYTYRTHHGSYSNTYPSEARISHTYPV